MKRALLFFCPLLFSTLNVWSQERVWTVGAQLKPIFSARMFGTGPQTLTDSNFIYTLRPKGGYAAGMVIRRGYTKTLSLEFGINFTARNYQVSTTGGPSSASTRFRIVGYEIPFSQLVFIRLSEHVFMNVAGGVSLNMFPSDIVKNDPPLMVYAGRKWIFHSGLLANVGFEYRSKKSGYFYLGASLNRPFYHIYTLAAQYQINKTAVSSVLTDFRGSYLTLDLRYFFHEDPEKRVKKKSK